VTLRKISLACVVIGLVLVVLSFVEPPVADPSRPNLLYVGIGVVLVGIVLATAGAVRSRRRGDISADVGDLPSAAVAEVSVLEPAAPVAPPRAQLTLLVGGNGASEPSVRWYHAAAVTTNGVAAPKARLSVGVRGEQAGAQWRWQAGGRDVELTQLGARIPIVIGAVSESAAPLGSGWVVPFKNWYLTPNATSALGPFLAPFIAGVRHVFDVTVTWDERGVAQSSSAGCASTDSICSTATTATATRSSGRTPSCRRASAPSSSPSSRCRSTAATACRICPARAISSRR